MIASSLQRLQGEIGPCPGCFDGRVDLWLCYDTDIESCFLLLWKKTKKKQIVRCNACDVWMDVQDYRQLQRSTTAWGVEVISKRFEMDGDTQSSCSCNNTETTKSEDTHHSDSNGGNSAAVDHLYVSLAELIAANQVDQLRACCCCNWQLQETWRFCPMCGMFVDSFSSDAASSVPSVPRLTSLEEDVLQDVL